jgi:phosphohistidine phosphatase
MRQLLLLRHAKSSWEDPNLSDHDRPLDPEGQSATQSVRVAIARLELMPQLVLVSSARRTRETLDLLQPLAGSPRIRHSSDLYLANPRQILDALVEVPSHTGSVLVIGHNPGLHDLAMMLAGAHAMSMGREGGPRRIRRRRRLAHPPGWRAADPVPRASRPGVLTVKFASRPGQARCKFRNRYIGAGSNLNV